MKTIMIIFVSVLLQFVNAQNIEMTLPLWEKGEIPNYKNSGEKEYEKETAIYDVQTPTIKIYKPSKYISTGIAVIIAPGGAYKLLSYEKEGTDIAKRLASFGITGIVLKYRLPTSKSNIISYKSPLLDIKRAVRMVRHNAEKWGLDKNKVGVMGFSAGGHLVSTLGTHFDLGNQKAADAIEHESCRPNFMVLIYPVISFNSEIAHKGSIKNLLGKFENDSLINYFSNELHISKNTPPTFMLHAANDRSVPVANSLAFFKALNKNKIPVEIHIFPKGGHGFGLALDKGRLAIWSKLCREWILNEMN
jgi:acetyl esterase/lipase